MLKFVLFMLKAYNIHYERLTTNVVFWLSPCKSKQFSNFAG